MTKLDKEIARLDGFVSGVAARNGGMKQYSAGAYLVDLSQDGASVEAAIKRYYEWLPNLAFTRAHRLEGGMHDFEIQIRQFLVIGDDSDEAALMRKHLSFTAMEIVSSALGGDYRAVLDVVRVSNVPEPMSSTCEYFCIRLKEFLIVLQFNDDTEFWKKRD